MAKVKQHNHAPKVHKSKRKRNQQIVIYLMIISMLIGSIFTGLSFFIR